MRHNGCRLGAQSLWLSFGGGIVGRKIGEGKATDFDTPSSAQITGSLHSHPRHSIPPIDMLNRKNHHLSLLSLQLRGGSRGQVKKKKRWMVSHILTRYFQPQNCPIQSCRRLNHHFMFKLQTLRRSGRVEICKAWVLTMRPLVRDLESKKQKENITTLQSSHSPLKKYSSSTLPNRVIVA